MTPSLEEFKMERNAALLSMNESRIRAMVLKFNGIEMPHDEVFWGSVHKAITGCLDLPIEFRKASKTWLNDRHLTSLDDGDL